MQKGGEVKMTCWINANGNPPKPPTLEDLGYVQVVRCKDCKHWDADDHECNIKTGWFACGADWFCADGERKEGR